MTSEVLDDLVWRGLIAHSTDLDALRSDMSDGPLRFYVGFDPTAPSLHMGNLMQVVTAQRLQAAGHVPYVLVGGATGMIGDPKESGERTLKSLDVVKGWVERVRHQVEPFFSFDGDNPATIVDNYDWTASLSTIDFLRDIGKHFPVNRMLARDVVRSRLEAGISYTEFSYVLLQSLDYLNLFRSFGVRLQTGGSDQWGNLTGGVELVRRVTGARVHAVATPLVTRADGTKYGKTETGALWLDREMMSPYAFHQFWVNAEDDEVVALLKYFTFRGHDEIDDLQKQTVDRPSLRAAQRALADDVTTLAHGPVETRRAKAAAEALFGGGELAGLDSRTLDTALRETPHIDVTAPSLPTYAELLADTSLTTSRSAARRTVADGGAYVNNRRIVDADAIPTADDVLPGGWLVLRRGKRSVAGVRWHRSTTELTPRADSHSLDV
ncbi:MAG: tyrosine--tRNA ligase [Propionibacteriales bacterium]|nr:tyrosine--tRNA ligase [Propionibacteriales bacterium]